MLGWFWMMASRIWGCLSRRSADQEFVQELESHCEMLTAENVRRGMAPEEARRAARVRLGGMTQISERHREMHTLPLLETIVQDIRYGLRILRKSPGFTSVAVLTLALGIGANTAIFTVINAVMVRALPVQRPDELVTIGDPARVYSWSTGTPRTDLFSYPLYRELRDNNRIFSSLLASSNLGDARIAIDAGPETANSRLVTENYFETLGVEALLGRTFTADDGRTPGSDPVLVISYGYLQRRFSADASVIGRKVRLNNYPFTIIGVAPPPFFGEVVGDRPDLWAPMMMQPQLVPGRNSLESVNDAALLLIGRLKPGVTIQQARTDVNAVVKQALMVTLDAKMSPDDRGACRMQRSLSKCCLGAVDFRGCGEMPRPPCCCS